MSKAEDVIAGREPFALECADREAERRAYEDLLRITAAGQARYLSSPAKLKLNATLVWLVGRVWQ